MSEYQLYCFAQSGNAYRAALMLNLIGVDWEPIWVDFFSAMVQRTPQFRSDVNEMGEAPVLVHDKRKLTQSGVILTYLAGRSGKFKPQGEEEELEALRWIIFDNQKVNGFLGPFRFLKNFAKPAGDPAGQPFVDDRGRFNDRLSLLSRRRVWFRHGEGSPRDRSVARAHEGAPWLEAPLRPYAGLSAGKEITSVQTRGSVVALIADWLTGWHLSCGRGRGCCCRRSDRILALVLAIRQPAERQTPKISERPNGEHLPGITDEHGEEQNHHDKHRQHHFRRHALADALSGEDRQTRDHQHRNQQRVEEGEPHHHEACRRAEKGHVDRQQNGDGTSRGRNAREKITGPDRLVRIVDHHIETGEPEARANRKNQRRNPASRFEFVQAPEIKDQCWRHTEIDEVGEAVELGTEARGPLEHPRNPPIYPVEQRGKHDGGERKFKLVLHREPDRGQTRAERKQCDQVRQQGPNRDRLEAPDWRRGRIERRKDHAGNIGP